MAGGAGGSGGNGGSGGSGGAGGSGGTPTSDGAVALDVGAADLGAPVACGAAVAGCPEGEHCEDEICRPNPVECQPACAVDQRCEAGACVGAAPCPNGPSDCAPREICRGEACSAARPGTCDTDNDCNAGEMCGPNAACLPIQVACMADADCPGDGGVCELALQTCSTEPVTCEMWFASPLNFPPAASNRIARGPSRAEGSCGVSTGPEVMLLLDPALGLDGVYCIDTFATVVDTVLYTRTLMCDSATEITCNDDAGMGTQSQLQVDTSNGPVYLMADTKVPRERSTISLNIAVGPCPP